MMEGGASRQEPVASGSRQTGRRSRLPVSNEQVNLPIGSPIHAVLGLPELLEFILDYAVHDKIEDTRVKTLKWVRLVNKNWLTGLTNVMRKNKEPVFKLTLTEDNSLSGSPFVASEGKLLDRFVAVMGQRVKGPFPTFKLKILEEFFRRENYDSLLTCLRECGQGLVEMEMIFPENGGSLPGMLPVLDLPTMHKLTVTFTNHKVGPNLPGNELTFADSANSIGLVQALLNGTSSLKIVTVPSYGPESISFYGPRHLEFVTFPDSITKLELRCHMTSENLEVLTRNKLQNLLTLTLSLDNVSYTEGLLSKIMLNFCEHLRCLTLIPVWYEGPPRHVNLMRFPVMKNLRKLTSSCYGLELEEGHPPLSVCFPQLEILSIYQHTPDMLRKWTSNTLKAVKDFNVGLFDDSKSARNYENTLPFSMESMQVVHLSFPNITDLTLNLSSGTQECGLKYLFMEMRQLNFLRLIVDMGESFASSDYWDSVFIGVPISVITALRENDNWDNGELKLKDEVPTIRMLTALEYLQLKTVVEAEDDLEEALSPMISDLTFKFALMKMANLAELVLYGRFKATNEMTTKWKNMGRYIEYSFDEN